MANVSYSYNLHITGDEFDRQITLRDGITTIGRLATNDISLPKRTISSRHAQIELVGNDVLVTDLGSTNGTLVNQTPLAPHQPWSLKKGDQISIGSFTLTLHVTEIPAEPNPEEEKIEEEVVAEEEIAPPPPAVEENEGAIATPPSPPPIDKTAIASVYLRAQLPDLLTQDSHHLLHYLPAIYHTDFMKSFMGIFEAIYTPMAWTIDNFDLFLSPHTSPATFLSWLGRWFDTQFDDTWTESQKRRFLAEAHMLFARRGTQRGLSQLLEIYTGVPPKITDLDDDDAPYSFTVRLPITRDDINPEIIAQLIDLYKPAHTTYKLYYKHK